MQQFFLQERLQIEGNNNWDFIITFPRAKGRGLITLHWFQWHPATISLHHFVWVSPSPDVSMRHPAFRWQPWASAKFTPSSCGSFSCGKYLSTWWTQSSLGCVNVVTDLKAFSQVSDEKDKSSQSSQILAEEMQMVCLQMCTPLLSLVVVTGLGLCPCNLGQPLLTRLQCRNQCGLSSKQLLCWTCNPGKIWQVPSDINGFCDWGKKIKLWITVAEITVCIPKNAQK